MKTVDSQIKQLYNGLNLVCESKTGINFFMGVAANIEIPVLRFIDMQIKAPIIEELRIKKRGDILSPS